MCLVYHILAWQQYKENSNDEYMRLLQLYINIHRVDQLRWYAGAPVRFLVIYDCKIRFGFHRI